jgi:hypothetical protein
MAAITVNRVGLASSCPGSAALEEAAIARIRMAGKTKRLKRSCLNTTSVTKGDKP